MCIKNIFFTNKNNHVFGIKEVPNDLKPEIFNILWDKYLTNLLFAMKKYWFIEYSSNPINDFEEEKELKILDIDVKVLEDKLNKMWAKKIFEWEIEDIYYDYPDFRFEEAAEKISFRIRRKKDIFWSEQYFYTIKRKRSKQTLKKWLRVCFEKEFQIVNMWGFKDLLIDVLELVKVRRKTKNRIAYSLRWIKFDIDFYKWIPTLLEIEAEHSSIAKEYIEKLWLSDKETSLSWSRWLFKQYWIKYEIYNSK